MLDKVDPPKTTEVIRGGNNSSSGEGGGKIRRWRLTHQQRAAAGHQKPTGASDVNKQILDAESAQKAGGYRCPLPPSSGSLIGIAKSS